MWKAFLLNLLIALGGRSPYDSSPEDHSLGFHALQARKESYERAHPSRVPVPGHYASNVQSLQGTPLSDFLPYGSAAGDLDLPIADESQAELKLKGSPFTFFNKTYTSMFVNNNAVITFGQGIPPYENYNAICGSFQIPLIASFWTDVDTRNGGTVHYRQTTKQADLDKAAAIVKRAFPATQHNLNVEWAVVATWDEVAFFGASPPAADCPGNSLRNTMQAIIVRDAKNSFVILLYNKLTWTVGTGVDQRGNGCTGRDPAVGNPAKAGFNYGDGHTFFFLPGSCTEDITKITEKSNFLENGKWAFKVTNGVINTCDIDCSNGAPFQIDPYNCSTYYQCSNKVPIKMICPPMTDGGRLVFDPSQNACVWPRDYPCKPFCQ